MYALLASHSEHRHDSSNESLDALLRQYGDLADDANLDRCLGMMMRYRRLAAPATGPGTAPPRFPHRTPTYARLFALLEEQYAERLGRPVGETSRSTPSATRDEIIDAYPGVAHAPHDSRPA